MTTQKAKFNPLLYISSGVACFAIALLDNLGILNKSFKKSGISKSAYRHVKNKLIVEVAFLELIKNGMLKKKLNNYVLTANGKKLAQYSGLIQYIYDGYSNLLSKQTKMILQKNYSPHINLLSILKGSNQLGERYIDPILFKVLSRLKFKGTICDLGCGDGQRLLKMCERVTCNGIGIEVSNVGTHNARRKLKKHRNIQIEKADIFHLKRVWPEVEVLTQTMVFHDLTPEKKCIRTLNSYLVNFPNLKYFLYCDIVAPSGSIKTQLPGFDYIHGMLNIKTRTYEETIQMFNSSKFTVLKEVPINKLPNTFVWVLGLPQ